jgi:hypothetical protein
VIAINGFLWLVFGRVGRLEYIMQRVVPLADAHTGQRFALEHASEKFPAYIRQQGIGQDGADHPPAALDFGATRDDQFYHAVVMDEGHLVSAFHAFLDPFQLQAGDGFEHRGG